MSWTRLHLNRMSTIQQEIQLLVDGAADESFAGLDDIVQANELLTQAQEKVKAQVEHHETALQFAESLRPFAEDHEHVWDGPREFVNESCNVGTCSICGFSILDTEQLRKPVEISRDIRDSEVEASV